MRKPHYWKPAKSQALPSNFLVFDCETKGRHVYGRRRGEFHQLVLGWAYAYRLERGERTREKWYPLRHKKDLAEAIADRLHRKIPLWVFGHNVGYDLGAIGFWNLLGSDACRWKFVVLDSGTLYMKGLMGGYPLVICDTWNYYHCSLAEIGKAVGLPKIECDTQTADERELSHYCRRDVEVTAAGLDALVRYVADGGYGPWGPTIASLAFNTYRKCFMDHQVLVHCHEKALRLERECYYGGIVDTPFVGEIPASPIFECDVASMYPYMCLNPIPVRFRRYRENVSVRELQRLLEDYHVFADVEVECVDRPVPVRWESRVLHCRGTGRATLPHPELSRLVRAGAVRRVYRVSCHDAAPAFRSYVEHFWREKSEFERSGNSAFRAAAKYLLNSLYGKTGQLSPRWRRWGPTAVREFERNHGLPCGSLGRLDYNPPIADTAEGTLSVPGCPYTLKYRCIFEGVELCTGRGESRDSVPSIAAVITSAARVYLRDLQDCAGRGHWWYSDTDSLWVDPVGLANLERAGHVQPETLGKLGIDRIARSMVVYAPKDYEIAVIARKGGDITYDGPVEVVKRKGIRASAEQVAPGTYQQLQFPRPIQQIKFGLYDGVFIEYRVKELRRRIDHCKLLPDGRTEYLDFSSLCG